MMSQAEQPVIKQAPAQKRNGGLFAWLGGMFRPPKQDAATPGKAGVPEGAVFVVIIAALNGDSEQKAAKDVLAALEARTGIRARLAPTAIQLENADDAAQMSAATTNARHLLAEHDADLVIWGDVRDGDGLVLRFSSAGSLDDDRPGGFVPANRLELPFGFDTALSDLLYAVVLAAADPPTDAHRVQLRQYLPPAVAACEALGKKPPLALSPAQQASVLLCFGHVAATLAANDGGATWYETAAAGYRAALKRLGKSDSPMETAIIHRHLGAVSMAQAEKNEDAKWLQDAVEAYRTAVETLTRATHPQEWGAAQNRLGLALYKLDLRTGDADALKEALAAFQAALQVVSRLETPQRWADIMHNLAQTLEIYGDMMRNADVLKRAIEACDAVLEVRSREKSPLAWAATQNTLGSALFMLDKHTQGTAHLDEATQALRQAEEVYLAMGAPRQAAVAAKNIQHVERLTKLRRERKVAEPGWADDQAPARKPPRVF